MMTFLFVVTLLLALLFIGLPVAFSLGTASLALIVAFDLPFKIIGQTIFSSMDSFVLLAVPLFILMSQVLLDGRVGDDLFDVMNTWVRHLPGGLAIATILSCAFFAAITGSSATTAATIGMVAFPALIERGYERRFVLGLLAAGGTLGILIPPSIPMILYGAVTEESVGKLFVAGIVPGLVLTAIFVIYAIIRSRGGGYRAYEPASWRERFQITRKNLWGIALPIIIIGGIYSGAFTPT
ncbi:MAG TPA: TRAP transporter large permease subunit, partial [Thermosynergistes sp.]|nr:TRAP transporter large permease subunit [Thermosynergistes sp.]